MLYVIEMKTNMLISNSKNSRRNMQKKQKSYLLRAPELLFFLALKLGSAGTFHTRASITRYRQNR